MIPIKKTKEPDSWTEHRMTPGAEYEASEDLKDSLLKDQGYICAYCMRRIPVKDKGLNEYVHIEHIKPRNLLSREGKMDFANMVICCPGAISSTSKDKTHCDRHKADASISFSPLDDNFIATIDYKRDGTIFSSNEVFNDEINKILNLNVELLKRNRMSVRKTVVDFLGSRKNEWKRSDLEKVLRQYQNRDEEGRLKEYCGVVINYINKKLSK